MPYKMIDWIKIKKNTLPTNGAWVDKNTLLTPGTWVIVTDGTEWRSAFVSKKHEFCEHANSRLVYQEITHYAEINLPKSQDK